MRTPRATYRLQFHKDFTFDHAIEVVPYLARLGISHVYASPIMQARPGSTHGYDITDHNRINPELGGEDGFYSFSDALKKHGLGLIVDIVPNHMGVGGADNACWLSVLEWGQLSPSAGMFDIDWDRLGAGGRLVVPFLGNRYGIALEAGELDLKFDAEEGSFSVWHWEHRFPVCPLSYPDIIDRALAALGDPANAAPLLSVSEKLRAMAEDQTPDRRSAFPSEAEALKETIAVAAETPEVREAIIRAVTLINGMPGTPESFGALHRLLDSQNYRLAHWRVAANEINYRRFFDINALGGIRVEEEEVFRRTHELVFRLAREGRIDGLRIDHIDGLADPDGYTEALQREVGPDFYVLVEKILEPGEKLRPWPVAGTTGYDILNIIDGVFVDTNNGKRFDQLYRAVTGVDAGYGTQLRAAKEEIVETSFASELEVIVSDLKRLADLDWATRDYTLMSLRRALVEIIVRLPVYRTYIGPDGVVGPEDRALIERSVRQAKRWSTLPDRSVHDFIQSALLGRVDTETPGTAIPDDVARIRRRFQQLTGPVMAKSLEDTLFYRYGRMISLNEVGGDPDHFGVSVAAFNAANSARASDWPLAMTATATHDTKRGEDTRARLNVLSEMPDEWAQAVVDWEDITSAQLSEIEGESAPDANDRFIILQGILGAWPLDLLDRDDEAALADFRERIQAWAQKALREAKRHTSWVNENADYETATADLIASVLTPGSAFIARLRPLVSRLARAGAVNALSRTVLKCTLPGVPDFYQGTEFWDFSLVDPDNRRPVDFGLRARTLSTDQTAADLLRNWSDARIKQRVIAVLLQHRSAHPDLYGRGSYEPLAAEGRATESLISFRRTYDGDELAVFVPRLVGKAMSSELTLAAEFWKRTTVSLPAGEWTELFSGRTFEGEADIAELLHTLPFAVLCGARGR